MAPRNTCCGAWLEHHGPLYRPDDSVTHYLAEPQAEPTFDSRVVQRDGIEAVCNCCRIDLKRRETDVLDGRAALPVRWRALHIWLSEVRTVRNDNLLAFCGSG